MPRVPFTRVPHGVLTRQRHATAERSLVLSYVASRTQMIAFIVAHVPLALLMRQIPAVATLHALTTFAGALAFAAFSARLDRVAYAGAYIAGAEVLWRMTHAQVFYEFGKYATAAVFMVALFRSGGLRLPKLPTCYFVLLLPSTALTIMNLDIWDARAEISFNLSGPFALMVSAWFFSHLKISMQQLHRLFLVLIAPACGIAAITIYSTVTSPDIEFTGSSNIVTSGGFGPNQVAATLGLGALLALFCALDGGASWWFRLVMFGAIVLLTVQSAMTFSRGGVYNAAAAAILGFLFLIRERRWRIRSALTIISVWVVLDYAVLPRLDAFTGGALSARFQDVDPTGRDLLFYDDIQIWRENPVLGVGPGRAAGYRDLRGVSAHTEFSRLVAEHGLFGFLALPLLVIAGVQNLRRAPTARVKAIAASMMAWTGFFMLGAAMRLVAPAFAFGLTFSTIVPDVRRNLQDLMAHASSRYHVIRARSRLRRPRSAVAG